MRAQRAPILLVALLVVLGSCAAPPPPNRPAPEPPSCRDPVYLELRAQHPDSLSDRAWDRLQELDAECRSQLAEQPADNATLGPGADHHLGGWLWMPAMMVLGGMMWLIMGAS